MTELPVKYVVHVTKDEFIDPPAIGEQVVVYDAIDDYTTVPRVGPRLVGVWLYRPEFDSPFYHAFQRVE